MREGRKINHKIEPGAIGYFNLLRGLGMILIIMGHSYTMVLQHADLVYKEEATGIFSGWGKVFGAAIMVMLFIISGYGFFKRRPKKCWSIQKELLLYPYIAVAVSVLLAKGLLAVLEQRPFAEHGGEYVLTYLLGLYYRGGGTLFGIPVEMIGVFWFVLALLEGWNIYNGICQISNLRTRRILIIGSAMLGYAMSCVTPLWPYVIHVGFLVPLYLAVGEWVRSEKWLSYAMPAWQWILLFLASGLSLAFGNCEIPDGIWRLGPLDVLGSMALALLTFRLYAWIIDRIPQNFIVRFIENIGRISIYVLSIHSFETVIFPWYRVGIFCGMRYGMGSMKHLVVATITVILLRTIVIYVIYQMVMRILTIKKKMKKKRKKRNRNNVG